MKHRHSLWWDERLGCQVPVVVATSAIAKNPNGLKRRQTSRIIALALCLLLPYTNHGNKNRPHTVLTALGRAEGGFIGSVNSPGGPSACQAQRPKVTPEQSDRLVHMVSPIEPLKTLIDGILELDLFACSPGLKPSLSHTRF
ncbi:hypothetical protein BDM02DRAFT_2549389 [Thelephora ganbajun]|uniref:Uncharacterized protein n=1 Tax=Thelephora ganbajun TaxID=370292 RepID=A0ACB6ZT95_THEGA|nr:hypothetical protein BDM02DRAFT_2549389 [Thelephora ganbajun]